MIRFILAWIKVKIITNNFRENRVKAVGMSKIFWQSQKPKKLTKYFNKISLQKL